MEAIVLGCGPAGLIAAERMEREGVNVRIVAKKMMSVMPGAQYLHAHIPGVTTQEPFGYLHVVKTGTKEGYAEKVYGDQQHPVSWENYEEGYVPAWSLAEAYKTLWVKWEERIIDRRVVADHVNTLAATVPLVVSTIPAPILCCGECEFRSTRVYFSEIQQPGVLQDEIVYNGRPLDQWYRSSVIFGHGSTEYATQPGNVPSVEGRKPTFTNCSCPPANVIRLGRFGSWNKQFLVHHAWEGAFDALQQVQ